MERAREREIQDLRRERKKTKQNFVFVTETKI